MNDSQRRWRRTFWISAALAVLLVASLAPYLTRSTELVRLRNSLLYVPAAVDASWTPANAPVDFLRDRVTAPGSFRQIVAAQHLMVANDDWTTALRIGRHLLQRADASGSAGPIQRDLNETYRRIVDAGDGYCGDYVDAFTALASASGLFARSWAFSFDGFGGHGHVFNEIWDRQAQSWRMIDVFNNYYIVDSNQRPLSALEFRQRLLRGEPIDWRAVEPASRPGFIQPEKALEYYRRGMHQWYLWDGNNVFQNDGNLIVGISNAISPSLAQFSAIVLGVYPSMRVVADTNNEAMQRDLYWLGWRFTIVLIAVPVLIVLVVVAFWRMRSSRGSPVLR